MPQGAYIKGYRRISPVPPASARLDAASACIDEREKSRNRYPQGEWLFYAQRRGFVDVSAHGPFNICSVWHHLCAEASVRQRLCARHHIKGAVSDGLRYRFFADARKDRKPKLGMTEYKHSEGQGTDAQKVRLLSERCTDLRSFLQLTPGFTGNPFPMVW